ncbi:MAG: carboxypeptidase-like regulatory domain-containing protein, partial [Candidatus Neomarinimicrobiota bacterium]|nr:carboxypeptidase-like regulatory domain-containing protein [Candidatus Neomarinimicrobiota bacterium]
MKPKFSPYLFFHICCFITTVFAIDVVNIEGFVIDDVGSPLVGSNIIIKNTTHGGATNTDGFYQFSIPIEVAQSSPLVFASYIGYRSIIDTLFYNNEKEIIK